mgnify:CR=1 FL=1
MSLALIIGISYAWFSTIINGNEEAKKHSVTTGDLRLIYTDTTTITLENIFPGESYEKVISVKNSGTENVNYSIIWQELTNGIINDELVIEGSCKRYNKDGVEDGTCKNIDQRSISSLIIESNILIESGYTHEYSLKVTFIDTSEVQNYNKNKSFNGKIGIEEYKSNPFMDDTWKTIVSNVKAGNIDKYNVGDEREINLGKYGIHVVRVSNKSYDEKCDTDGFSQTSCGFVIEFKNIISKREMNLTATNKGGWPASAMYTFLNNDLYNEFPEELKDSVIDTLIVSGRGSNDTDNFVSTDKIYLLAPGEIFGSWAHQYDLAHDKTKQLDYYKNKNVTTSNYSSIIKKFGTVNENYWLRTAYSIYVSYFYNINNNGSWNVNSAINAYGVSPAFRIG